MGTIVRQSKRWLYTLLLVSVLTGSMILTSCGSAATGNGSDKMASGKSSEDTSKDKNKNKESNKDKEDKDESSQEDIPSELLPGTDAADASTAQSSAGTGSTDTGVYDASSASSGSQTSGSAGGSGSSGGSSGSSSGSSNNTGNTASGNGTSGSSSNESSTISVSFQVESSEAASYGYNVSYSMNLALDKGATVYDALAAANVGAVGSGSYIQGIGGLYEFDCGPKSGWKYYVNGTAPTVGCNKYTLQNGDSVVWSYTLNP